MWQAVARNVRLYLHMVLASIRAQMEYRYAFVMNILGWAMTYTGTAVTIWVILYEFETLDGWTFWELIFLFALAVLSWGICAVFFFHFRSLDQHIVNGTFDRFLIRPVHPFFHFMALKFDVGAFGPLLFSVGAFVLAYWQLGLQWNFWRWLVFFGALLGGTLIQAGVVVLISALAFWTTRSERFYWVVMYPAKSLMNYPLSIYPRIAQWVLIYLVPFAFVNYFPALFLLGKTETAYSPVLGVFSPLVGIAFFSLCFRVWVLGVNRYKSTGS
ncbi:ABC transporter permease [Bacillaceae bacterium]